jgi:hypothetical protein
MVYHGCGIAHLSASQKAKLKAGHPVRMKIGSGHTLPLTEHQIKKLQSAHRKGSAHTVHLDPYQIDHLKGSGFFDSLKSIAKTVAPVVRPIATNFLKQQASNLLGPMGSQVAHSLIDIGDQQAQAHGYGIQRRVGRPKATKKTTKKIHGAGWGMDLLKGASKALRPVATNFIQEKLANRGGIVGQLGNVALNLANQEAEKRGFGVKRRVGRPRKHHGGALIASGY